MSEHWTGPWARLLRAQRRGTDCRLTAAEVRRVLRDAPSIRKCMECGETRALDRPRRHPDLSAVPVRVASVQEYVTLHFIATPVVHA